MNHTCKRSIAVAMVIAMATSLSACSTNGAGTTVPAESTASGAAAGNAKGDDKNIVFWNIATEDPDKGIFEYAVKKYNEEGKDGYTVEMVTTQNDSYKEKLVVAMSSGQCPDMYTSWSGGPMNEYIDSGFAQPIDELVSASPVKDKVMDGAWAQASYNNKIYGVPTINVSISGVFYNKEMFDKYGLVEPKTLSELENICATLKSNNITPFSLANSSKWTGSMYFMNLAARKGGLEPFAKAVDGSGSFEDECFKFAGDKIQEWVKNGYFPDGVNSLSEDDGQARQLLYQEKAAMCLIGSWYTGNIKNDSEEFYQKIGWFSFPALDGSSADASIQIGTVGDQFISFNCTGDKLKAAFDCASYYSTDEAVQLMVDKGKIPPIKGIDSKLTDPLTQKISAAANNASSVQLWYDQYLPPAVSQTHLNTSQELFGLTKTPEQANQELQVSMQAYIADK